MEIGSKHLLPKLIEVYETCTCGLRVVCISYTCTEFTNNYILGFNWVCILHLLGKTDRLLTYTRLF